MTVSIIAAMSDNGVIGKGNDLPWHLPADLKFFKKTTMGKPIIMGRKTFESMGKKPLPGRKNIVVTRQQDYEAPGATVVHSLDAALDEAGDADEIMVGGGSSIYEEALPQTDRMYLTLIHEHFEGDTRFPQIDPSKWEEVEREDFEENGHPYAFSFVTYERK
ncbi:MAG: dihydrofolate reductase [Candidatus Marinimicrobia bacterium]|nr:dihydrofolate reductase [Candidatus Neomarinimicrobiota bacterium]MCF7828621.1 dihydrofolate reductase [Candidatus Neomarinimicrobiota bacterium]MCF7880362.1 dihydrofolate reductase [Candidatus Neomarinimicrobiota bacterium]